jgi:hypothetical protein
MVLLSVARPVISTDPVKPGGREEKERQREIERKKNI